MAYTVNKTNSSASPNQYTVQDGVVNTQTDLSFIGKGYAGYGEVIAENFLHLLKTFQTHQHRPNPYKDNFGGISRFKDYKYTRYSIRTSRWNVHLTNRLHRQTWHRRHMDRLGHRTDVFLQRYISVLVGPPSATGTTNGFIYDTILDSLEQLRTLQNCSMTVI